MSERMIKVTGGPDRKTHRYGPGVSGRRGIVFGPQRGRSSEQVARFQLMAEAYRERILADLGVTRPLQDALNGGSPQRNIQDQRSQEND